MQTSHLVVLAIDMPFVTREQLQFLCSKATEGSGVVPMVGERAEPLAAVYPREATPAFIAALAEPDRSLQPLVRKLIAAGRVRMFSVSEQDEGFYRSINTPADLS
jgi:molybdopterin-guanine dinucleotide biosynthesis protein A